MKYKKRRTERSGGENEVQEEKKKNWREGNEVQ
jgi:hypothetical protein